MVTINNKFIDWKAFEKRLSYLQSVLWLLSFCINKFNQDRFSIPCRCDLYIINMRNVVSQSSQTKLYKILQDVVYLGCKNSSMIINITGIYKDPLSQLTNFRIKSRHNLIQSLYKSNLQNTNYYFTYLFSDKLGITKFYK